MSADDARRRRAAFVPASLAASVEANPVRKRDGDYPRAFPLVNSFLRGENPSSKVKTELVLLFEIRKSEQLNRVDSTGPDLVRTADRNLDRFHPLVVVDLTVEEIQNETFIQCFREEVVWSVLETQISDCPS